MAAESFYFSIELTANEKELIGKNMHHQIHHSKRNGTLIPISECRIVKAAKEGTSFHADDEIFWRKGSEIT